MQNDIRSALMNVKDFVDSQSVNKETSKVKLLERALNEFRNHVQYDIQLLQPTLRKLRDESECLRWYVCYLALISLQRDLMTSVMVSH